MVTKLPVDFDIFSLSTCRKPLCIQTLAMRSSPKAQQVCASSFSWCGNTRSMPPPWMSNCSPRCFHAIAEHSICQPGRPSALMPAGDGHDGSPGFDGFPTTNSAGARLVAPPPTPPPPLTSLDRPFGPPPQRGHVHLPPSHPLTAHTPPTPYTPTT